jgi:hypothetical protein
VTATGHPTPTLTRTGVLPNGVTFTDNGDGTASLTGTPAPGSRRVYHITITASGGIPLPHDTQHFTLTVQP